ncbi:SDR family oxidoreductase [Georgenia halophila]|uniref:SDR family oxidoreductase n=1 Tax=Georgenia halophila TaxID=620889 RepID=A0ABP8LL36_9MICO
MRIKGSVVVITGASDGIGRATALRFAKEGAAVVLAARRREPLETLAAECREHGAEAIVVSTDVADERGVIDLARRTVTELGRIDVWVNNAAVGIVAPFLDTPLHDLQRLLEVNVVGVVHGSRVAVEQMIRQRAGVVINVSSVLGEVPAPYNSAYSMSKSAVRALGFSLRQELRLAGAKDVHVCSVLPPSVDTPYYRQVANFTGREARPIPPLYTPERVARTICSLVRSPRREAVVGTIGRIVVLKHRLFPGTMERFMSGVVSRTHLSRRRVPQTTGSLYGDAGEAPTVHGGHHGRARSMGRTVAAAALGVGGYRLLRRRA